MTGSYLRDLGKPFLITVIGVVVSTLATIALTRSWSCRATECDVLIYVWPVTVLPAALVIGYLAGREATTTSSGFVAVAAGVAVSVVILLLVTDWSDDRASGFLLLFPFVLVPILPTYFIARGQVSRRLAASLPWPADQAPPNHRCGRCGKPLSPVWKAKCMHCGARYAEFPPVPRTPT